MKNRWAVVGVMVGLIAGGAVGVALGVPGVSSAHHDPTKGTSGNLNPGGGGDFEWLPNPPFPERKVIVDTERRAPCASRYRLTRHVSS